jgi:hypothetical protein
MINVSVGNQYYKTHMAELEKCWNECGIKCWGDLYL